MIGHPEILWLKGWIDMDDQQRKALLKETFDAVAGGYDNSALRFFPASAGRMAALLGLRGDEHVLDVACGTGHASLAMARLLPHGRVTAVDFSPGMLAQARHKAAALGAGNVEFLERDMQALGFPDGTFDDAISAFGIFFAEDMDAQLARIVSAVKPGGTVMISCFQERYFHPLKDLLNERLARYGVQPPPQTWKRIASEEGCRDLFKKAGLREIRVVAENLGYFLENAAQWWDIVWNAGFRRMVGRLAPDDQAQFKSEHLEEIAATMTRDGIWLDVGVLFTSGTKP
jgi:ubiquinone/menaquinone biosynthesis C-methylase UbiE